VLKLKFRKLHSVIASNLINPVSVINFLFQKAVIGADDMTALLRFRDDPQQQCGEMLALLHTSRKRQAFVQLYVAIKNEPQLQWLVDVIDEFTDQSLRDQRYIDDTTGKCVLVFYPIVCLLHTNWQCAHQECYKCSDLFE